MSDGGIGNQPKENSEFKVDLTNCDREPIHLLGRVQSYGALLAVSSDWIIQQASENLSTVLGLDYAAVLGRPLSEFIVSDAMARIRGSLRTLELQDGAIRLFGVALTTSGQSFDVCVHQSGAHLVIEVEEKSVSRPRDVMSEVYPHIAVLRNEQTMRRLARNAARGIQEISGFDSVMVYQFQPDNSGKVIAEYRVDGKTLYDGMLFPASDIPVQARALYKRSLLRLIADVDDAGSVVRPGVLPGGEAFDLSLAVTRSVSPIHIEYLRNMGVRASMSVSIMKDGELWGLFACHHHSPHYIDYERRTAIEMFGHMFSYEISRFEEGKRKIAEADAMRLQTLLMGHLANGDELAASLLAVSEDIRGPLPHDGLILFENEVFHSIGTTATEEEFRALARSLDRSIGSDVFVTDQIGKLHPEARDYANRCAGMLVIPISRRPRDYLVLTRRQIIETVEWAGDPTKPVTVGPNGHRLTPRKSFDAWRETVEGRSLPWTIEEKHMAEILRTILLEIFLKVTDAANQQRKRAQEQQSLLISELNHRVRNILNLMRGLLSQSRSSANSLEDFTSNLDGRIHALARAHDQLTAEKWEPASLRALIACEFAAYADGKGQRVHITGPDAMIHPSAFSTLALVLHELATNAVKYGALCDQAGKINVTLSSDQNGGLLLSWVEIGGPPVQAPKRRGFGTVIIESSIPHELKGDSEVSYKITGFEARFRIPPKHIAKIVAVPETVSEAASSSASDRGQEWKLDGACLVVEDSLIIAMDAAGILEDLGASHVEIASTVSAALRYLDKTPISFAVLDVNLGDEQSIAVAERLHQMGTPFVLATGYGTSADLQNAYPPCTIVQKPFSVETLADAAREATLQKS